ncbi:Cloroperoxidase, partial [Bimuria novae-zelandiae CBS 107.79]
VVLGERRHWRAPSKDDSRGPCPLLNSLANHGFLPHNGKHISVPALVNALDDALNLNDPGKAFFQAQEEKALTISTNKDYSTFNLLDLMAHNVIEHDGSLSRADGARTMAIIGGSTRPFSTRRRCIGPARRSVCTTARMRCSGDSEARS